MVVLTFASAALGTRPFTTEELLQTKLVADPRVSPDGRWVAITLQQSSLAENRRLKDVWLVPLAGGEPRPLSRDGRTETARWSPDGKTLLVHAGDPPQLFVYSLSGGDRQQLTFLPGGVEKGDWSPDGRLIAFAAEIDPSCTGEGTGLDQCLRKKAEERTSTQIKARIIDHLFARHWSSWRDGKRSHLWVMPAQGGPPRDLTPGDADWPTWMLDSRANYAFTADGADIVVASKPSSTEAWSTNGDLWLIPTRGGPPRNLTTANPGDDAFPAASGDGRYIAYASQERDGYESDRHRLMLLELKTGRTVSLGDGDQDVGHFAWQRDSKALLASFSRKGRAYLETISTEGKVTAYSPTPLGHDFDIGPDGSAVAVLSGMNRPPELFLVRRDGTPRPLTHFNSAQYAGLDLGPQPEELWVDGSDGTKVHSWLLKPPGWVPGKKVPLLVLIHGGPQGAWSDSWGMRWNIAAFAAHGYAVLTPNPRGSTGYGRKFTEQVSGDWGGLAYQDILRSVDAAERLPYIETGRTCAAGASFGGYMVNWIAGHTDRFKCLVSHDGPFELVSMYGSTEELWFPEFELGGPYWEKPESYRQWSPSSYAKNFKTPTLVVQGELDFRVPTEQGLGMFTALQRRGIESRLLWFPDEGHWVLKPRNSQLWYKTVLDWIDAHSRSGSLVRPERSRWTPHQASFH